MATAETQIKPIVYADLVRERMAGKAKISNLATNLGILKNTNVGEVVTFPKWKIIGDCTKFVKGQPISTEELEHTSSQAEIQMAVKGVTVYDIDDITQLGNAINEGIEQQSLKFAKDLDAELVKCILGTPLKVSTASGTAITADELNQGLQLFGDDQNPREISLVINSLLIPSFLSMPEFTDSSKLFNTAGNGIMQEDCLGHFRGVPVYVANIGTYNSTTSTCQSFFIKSNALAYMEKRDINIELAREANFKRTSIYGDYIYAVHAVNEGGIVTLSKAPVVTP